MKKILITIAISLITISISYSQSKINCEILQKGVFTYGESSDDIRVYFNGKKHKELHNHNNKKYFIKSEIMWVNKCEYNMTMKKITIPDFPYKKGDIMNVVINKVDNNKIYYTSTVNGQSWKGVFVKIK